MLTVASCSTTGSTLDMLLPDRWGLGAGTAAITGKTYGSGSSVSHGGGQGAGTIDRYEETYKGDETITATWFEWDIPNVSADRVSFEGMRDSFIQDYRGRSAQSSTGLISVSRQVDETGAETWSIGASEALTTALLALLAALGYKARKDKRNGTK